MYKTIIMLATAVALACGITTAMAAHTYPAEPNTIQAQKTYRGGHVRGLAYGYPGEQLGPVYMHTTGPEMTPDPRTCGPGACQENPLY